MRCSSDGDVAERYVYDPYGNCTVYDDDWSDTVSWANSKKNNIRFCGYYFDNETGLYNPRTRYYHPYFGWITRDRTEYDADGMSLYQYVKSAPVSSEDPLGLWTRKVHLEDTEQWARAVGYHKLFGGEEDCAVAIAQADNGIDNYCDFLYPTSPAPIIGDFRYHFDTDKLGLKKEPGARDAIAKMHLESAKHLAGTGAALVIRGILRELGKSLHPLQDKYAHKEGHNASTPFDHAPSLYCAWWGDADGTVIPACIDARKNNRNWPDWGRPDDRGKWPDDYAETKRETERVLKELLGYTLVKFCCGYE